MDSDQDPPRLRIISDPVVVAALEAEHASAIADAMIASRCAHSSYMFGVACTCHPGHAGPHNNGEWEWGYNALDPDVLRGLQPPPADD